MRLWLNSRAKQSGTVLLVLAEGDNSGALVDAARRTKVSQLLIHSSCDNAERSVGSEFFRCFADLQRIGNRGMSTILSRLDRVGMHPQLYASEDVCAHKLTQTEVQVIKDDEGHCALMINMLRGCVVRFIHRGT